MPPKKDQLYKPPKNWQSFFDQGDRQQNMNSNKKSSKKSQINSNEKKGLQKLSSLRKNTSQKSQRTRQQSRALLRRSSQNNPSNRSQVWNSQSQIGTKSKILKQYQRYFHNSENTFHTQTPLMKQDALINWLWKKVTVVLIINIIIWSIIYSIDPYQKNCPRHATCGAYVHCHQGYILTTTRNTVACEIDPEITNSALVIMNSVIQQLKYQYGNKQCQIPENITQYQRQNFLQPPSKHISQIYKQLDIDESSQVLRTQLSKLFSDRNNQIVGNFEKVLNGYIKPKQKKYSLQCRLDLFYRDNLKLFLMSIFVLTLGFIALIYKMYSHLQVRKARKIYFYLKSKVRELKQIKYDDQRLYIQEQFNYGRQLSSKLWVMVNECRIKEKLIGSYQDQHIRWRWL